MAADPKQALVAALMANQAQGQGGAPAGDDPRGALIAALMGAAQGGGAPQGGPMAMQGGQMMPQGQEPDGDEGAGPMPGQGAQPSDSDGDEQGFVISPQAAKVIGLDLLQMLNDLGMANQPGSPDQQQPA